MANALKWTWALQDKDKALGVMGLSSGQPEKAEPLPTVENQQRLNNQRNSSAANSAKSTATITKEPKCEAFSWSDDDFLEGWNSVYNDEPKRESPAEKLRKTRERIQSIGNRQASSNAFGGSYKWATTPISTDGKTRAPFSAKADIPPSNTRRGGALLRPKEEQAPEKLPLWQARQASDKAWLDKQDRLFFEGFYDVDGATGDYEREKRTAQVDEALRDLEKRKPGDMLRWSVRNTLNNPESSYGFYADSPLHKHYYEGKTWKEERYGEGTLKHLDEASNVLTAASLIPGLDTFADMAAFPVDLLRADYTSAGLDVFGILPFVGEIADTAKLARAGIKVADTAHDAGKVIDAVKIADKADDVADVVKAADDVYDYAKIIEELPITADDLIKQGWRETTDPRSLLNNPKLHQYEKDGIQIKFEKATPGATGFRGIDHYHIINPKATGNHDYYLDKFGRPVSRKSKHSHIIIGGK